MPQLASLLTRWLTIPKPAGLDDDAYRFRDDTQEWVGERSRRRYKLGDRLRVIVARIDALRQRIEFKPVP